MKVLFLEVDTEEIVAPASIGAAYVGAYLRAHGHEAVLLRATVEMSEEEIVARVAAAEPGLVGISLTSRQWLRGRALIAAIREGVGTPTVAGGVFPTFLPEEVLARPGFDYVCRGEGEEAALDLVDSLERGEPADSIPNIWRRGGERQPLRKPFKPIDDLPFLARDLVDEQPGIANMVTQRGCPFPCTYCSGRTSADLYGGVAKYARRRSVRDVLDELLEIKNRSELGFVVFLDDTFTINHAWLKTFCRLYAEEIQVPFSIHARVDTVDERLLAMLAEAGCRQALYGVECGSTRIRKEVLHRPIETQRFRDVFRWSREAGLLVFANYMLGLPEETREDVEQTLALAEELDAFDFGYFVFYPFPGTHLHAYCREKGYLPDDALELPAVHRRSILKLPTLSQEDIEELHDRFTALRERVYLRHAERFTGAPIPEEERDAFVAHVRDHARKM